MVGKYIYIFLMCIRILMVRNKVVAQQADPLPGSTASPVDATSCSVCSTSDSPLHIWPGRIVKGGWGPSAYAPMREIWKRLLSPVLRKAQIRLLGHLEENKWLKKLSLSVFIPIVNLPSKKIILKAMKNHVEFFAKSVWQ